jgi:putative salt-induced outer membrane protein YdiY
MRTVVVAIWLWTFAVPAWAQQQPPPEEKEPQIWTVAASAGLALTSGNSDTSNVNAAYEVVYDPQTRNVVRSDGLYLRGETDGVLSADRLSFNIRDQYSLTPRVFVFGQNQYLQDEFKSIDYLIAPGVGLGYKIFDTERTKFDVDGGIGGVWEKNPGLDVRSSAAVTAGEKLSVALTGNTSLTQSVAALWKTNDWDDALYTFGAGVAVAMSQNLQLKVELLNTFKNRPPDETIRKNDVAFLTAIVFKK